MSINLAPNHKQGLVIPNPVLLAGGTIGYGEAIQRGVQPAKLGGVVVGPLMYHGRAGTPPPRLAESNGGFVLHTGLQNRGIASALKRFAHTWTRLGCPVIAQVADTQPDALGRVLERLMLDTPAPDTISGIELLLPTSADAAQTRSLVQMAALESDYPVLVKLPLTSAVELASIAVASGADALVVAQPPIATGMITDTANSTTQPGTIIHGALYGPLTFATMFSVLVEIAALSLPCAVIACGGIHTRAQAQQALTSGADAVQVDSAVWVEPGLPVQLVDGLAG